MDCERCAYYSYDEELDEYTCQVNMDEDDFERLSFQKYKECPYYTPGDEYLIARKQ